MLQFNERNTSEMSISMHLQPNMWSLNAGNIGSLGLRTVATTICAGRMDATGLTVGLGFGNCPSDNDKRFDVGKPATDIRPNNDNRLYQHFTKPNMGNNYPRPGGAPPKSQCTGRSLGSGGGTAAS